MSYKQDKRILSTLRQIEKSILLLQEWNRDTMCADDYMLTPEGTKNLAASSMLVEAIGEAFKKIDKERKELCCHNIQVSHGKQLKEYVTASLMVILR